VGRARVRGDRVGVPSTARFSSRTSSSMSRHTPRTRGAGPHDPLRERGRLDPGDRRPRHPLPIAHPPRRLHRPKTRSQHRRPRHGAALARRAAGLPPQRRQPARRAELAPVPAIGPRALGRGHRPALRDPAAPGAPAVRAGPQRPLTGAGLGHGGLLRDEHELAELLRRGDDRLRGRHRRTRHRGVRFRGGRTRRLPRPGPRPDQAPDRGPGKFLGQLHPLDHPRVAPALGDLRRRCSGRSPPAASAADSTDC